MDVSGFEIRLLGPFEVRQQGQPVGPAGPKRRGLLALLALSAGRVVPVTELIDGLWGDAPPASAANLVQTYVSAWRKALDPDEAGGGGSRIVTVGPGYRLELTATELDFDQCSGLLTRARDAAAAGRHAEAAGLLSGALELWRGPPLADLAREPFYRTAAERLDEQYLQLIEDWAAATLTAGHGGDVANVLRQQVQRAPLRERLSELLMWALFQGGRQADALAVYEDIRQVLANELGADPGSGLQDMHLRVLRQDAALRAMAAEPALHNLPRPADSFIDREPELRQVTALLAAHRLVTLTGTGGSGKTRLAIEVAAARQANEDVFFVDAGPLVDATLLPERVASLLGVRPGAGQSVLQALRAELARWQLLVVVDNLEHLDGAAVVVASLLSAAPNLRVLATSREPLHARGEQLYPVPPLPLSSPGGEPEGIVTAPAIALFADRARAANPHFVLSPETTPAAVGICRQLDGLPLAIELAAGWLRLLPADRLLARLDRRLDLLADTRSDRPGRQRTLRGAIDWSYQLLDPPSRSAYRALAVFRGGWTVAGAAAVCNEPDESRLLGTLMNLADKNLIEKDDSIAGAERFRMLGTLREYALDQLAMEDEEQACRRRHADYITMLAADAGPQLTGRDQNMHLDHLEAERDNISTALRWLRSAGLIDQGLRVCGSLWRFWHLRAHMQEASQLLEDLLSAASEETDPAARASGLAAAGSLAYWQLDYGTAQQHYAQALTCYHQAHDAAGIAEAHYNLGFTTQFVGDNDQARALFEQAASEYHDLSDELGQLNALTGIALLDHRMGNTERARQQGQASLDRFRALGDQFAASNCLSLLGSILRAEGNLGDASIMLREALTAHHEADNLSGIAWMLHELAGIAFALNQTERAHRLAGAAARTQGQGGTVPVEQLPLTRPSLGPPDQPDSSAEAQAWREGQQMSRAEAVAEALSEPPPRTGASASLDF